MESIWRLVTYWLSWRLGAACIPVNRLARGQSEEATIPKEKEGPCRKESPSCSIIRLFGTVHPASDSKLRCCSRIIDKRREAAIAGHHHDDENGKTAQMSSRTYTTLQCSIRRFCSTPLSVPLILSSCI
ncbi:uncharacterized protein B0I36DRAFT_335347 [Microdochium trichocladiopsis]|uniref:Secreted protein n=1 Tax=Microdochium trichocladiopsis TaxID=1682393 RepID=A0A9P8XU30_9PEZI|nr:uncharacterized protein B0I36DRAFT_335347 [Microdochium trichocladiopsis]KAH7018127.1 hypothetical protein B0I36DRAFT_335347 [Microdochium trichocladiopsis]